MKMLEGILCFAVLIVFGAGAAWAGPQGNQQQKCINKVNKAGTKVQAAQGKANAACVKDFVKGAITGVNAAENCVLDDPKEKVEAKQANTVKDHDKNCLTGQLPDFGYTNAATVNTAAYQAEVDLVHDVFGNPVDAGLYLCDTDPNECLCQRQASSRIEKLFRAMSKIWLKCKNPALAIGKLPFEFGAGSASDLQECVTNGAITLSVENDMKNKIADATTQLSDTVAQFCDQGDDDEFGGGLCVGLTGAPRITCLVNRVKCRFCRMVNAVDALAINCSTWSGVTCP